MISFNFTIFVKILIYNGMKKKKYIKSIARRLLRCLERVFNLPHNILSDVKTIFHGRVRKSFYFE